MDISNPVRRNRRSIRLSWFDYRRNGAYFVTICTFEKRHTLASVEAKKTILTDLGRLASSCWLEIPQHNQKMICDAFVIMPNHVHGLLLIADLWNPATFTPELPRTFGLPIPRALSTAIANYKAAVTRKARRIEKYGSDYIWQRNFYERIIRDTDEFNAVRFYIHENPKRWHSDRYVNAESTAECDPYPWEAGLS